MPVQFTGKDFHLLEDAERRLKGIPGGFTGGHVEDFYRVGEESLATALACGLTPTDSLLDHGCGVFRCGWWFLRYLNDWRYYAIDSSAQFIHDGMLHVVPEMTGRMGGYRVDASLDFGCLHRKFDFVFSRELWSGFNPEAVVACLRSFVDHGNPGSKYLSSVIPASDKPLAAPEFSHSLDWLSDQAYELELDFQVLDRPPISAQSWVLFSKSGRV